MGAMSALQSYVEQQVLLITQDGRVIVGQLRGCDATGAIILSGSVERIFSMEEGVEEVPLGVYIVRGDSISLVGELDTVQEQAIDWTSVRAEPLPFIRHK